MLNTANVGVDDFFELIHVCLLTDLGSFFCLNVKVQN